MDVNADQVVTPLDALQVIIKLNAEGSGPLPSLGAGVQPSAFFDTNNDSYLTPIDALLVLIELKNPTVSPANTTQPLTVEIVPVNATTFLATYSQAMGASASNPANYNITTDDGITLEVLEAVMAQGESVVELRTAPQSSSSGYTVNIQNVTSQTGQTVFFEGRKLLTGNPKGAVVSVAATSSTRVVVVYNEAMADNALAPQHYVIADESGNRLLVTDARFDGPLGMVVVLTTAPQAKVHYNLNVFFVTDLQNDELTIRNGSFHGIAAPSLLKATPTLSTRLVLTFTGPVGDSALSPSTYKIEELSAAGAPTGVTLPVTQARFLGDQRSVVELTTASQSGVRYRITPTNALTDATGSPIPANATEFVGISGAPQLLGITPSGVNSILLTFSQAMSDDALSPTSYVIKNAAGVTLPVLNATFVGSERRLVQLFTGPQLPGIYAIQSITATNLGGNQVTVPTGSTASFPGAPAPSLDSATPTDPTHIVLTFGGAVGDSALSPSAYKIERLGAAGNVVSILPIVSATFVGGQRTVVSIATAEQANANYRISTTSALTDAAGVPLPVVQLNFAGIASAPPALVGATSTGPTTMLFTFSLPMSDDALSPSAYVINNASGSPLQVLSAKFVGTERRVVELTTSPQTGQNYTIVSINATSTGGAGGTAVVPAIPAINTIPGNVTPGESTPVEGPPRVVGAASLSNTSVLVAFSEPMADNVLNPSHYFIVQQNVNPEVGFVPVLSAVFNSTDRRSVLLTTASQNELTYAVTAVNVTDMAGNALGPAVIAGAQRVDPTTAQFPGTPPSGLQIVDTDGDGLSDNIEVRGWTVTIALLNGQTVTRQVTSDPNNVDADGDKLWDAQELNLGIDPRSADTDGDQLSDWAEFNEIYSDPTKQDSDGDALDDFLEFAFFKTSAVFADTDGDQINDGDEILGNRNPRVSDLPRPEISVGEVNLQLDVRFTETNDQERRDLETKAVSSTLTQSNSQTYTRSDTVALEAKLEITGGIQEGELSAFAVGSASVGYTFQQSSESQSETEQAYERSLSTDREVTRGFTVERRVEGASMSVAIDLRNVSSLAYRVKNLQVTAFLQDPQDHTRLKPLATLLPVAEPEDGFTLGPLVTERGPFEFKADSLVPALVESLMANSSGLVFRISNYDIIDENGRNFAFTSQEIIERTARLVIDYGGASSLRALLGGEAFDELKPGDETEIFRVSTSAGQVIDSNFDGVIDDDDRFATFDGSGKEVGITIFEALTAIGLTRYDEAVTPMSGLSDDEILSSYSTYMAPAETIGGINYPTREKIFRIRGLSNDALNQKYWEILTPLGIDRVTNLNDLVLKSNTPVSLNFVQDLDGDMLTADVEYFLRTSDSPLAVSETDSTPRGRDTDRDGLDDRYEALIGWTVTTPQRTYKVWSSPNRGDSNFDDLDGADDPLNLYNGSDAFAAPAGWIDANANGLRDRFNEVMQLPPMLIGAMPVATNVALDSITFSTNPGYPTGAVVQVAASGGGLIAGTNYFLRNLGGGSFSFYTSGTLAEAGTATGRINLTAGVTAQVGIVQPDYVLDPIRRDSDGDGINDAREVVGFTITRITDGTTIFRGPNPETGLSPNPLNPDTDGDTFPDGDELLFRLDPTDPDDVDTDGDGLPDPVELTGWDVTTIAVSTAGFQQGASTTLNRKSNINSVDSDEDGLTDYEEFFLGTNALDADTDGDEIDDILELLGYTLGHQVDGNDLGILTTLVFDADTDNDKRSDGAEAELVDIELNAWVVRVKGETPYRAYSHPLKADADFDGLVDGDEYNLDPTFPNRHSDPNNGNTDGDTRDDGAERGVSNPLAVDIGMTVVLESVEISAEGQYDYQINVRPPGTGVAGLSNTPALVFESESPTSGVGKVRVHNTGAYVAKISFEYRNASGVLVRTGEGGDLLAGQTTDYNPGDFGVPLNASFSVNMQAVAGGSNLATEVFVYTGSEAYARYTSGGTTFINRSFTYNGIAAPVDLPQDDVPLASRSTPFGLANDERFSVEGYFTIVTTTGTTTVSLGGLEGKKASKDTFTESDNSTSTKLERSVFSYIQVADKFIEDYYYEFIVEGVTVKISFYYIVG